MAQNDNSRYAAWLLGMAWGFLVGYCIFLAVFTDCRGGFGPVINIIVSLPFAIAGIVLLMRSR